MVSVRGSVRQSPPTLTLRAGYGSGRKLALPTPAVSPLARVTLVLSAEVVVSRLSPGAVGSFSLCTGWPPGGASVQVLAVRLLSTYTCRYCGSGSVVR